jgi:hypothetical protein
VRAVVKCTVCELALALYLLVVTSFKSPVNQITNPYPVSRRIYHVTMYIVANVVQNEDLHKQIWKCFCSNSGLLCGPTFIPL